MREALFGILSSGQALPFTSVLDLYSGSGALALEAISRGAARAVAVESSHVALKALRANVAALGVGDRVQVLAADVRTCVAQLTKLAPFDLVLADPPWASIEKGASAALWRPLGELMASGALAAGARIVVEHSSKYALESPGVLGAHLGGGAALVLGDSRRYGDTALAFYGIVTVLNHG